MEQGPRPVAPRARFSVFQTTPSHARGPAPRTTTTSLPHSRAGPGCTTQPAGLAPQSLAVTADPSAAFVGSTSEYRCFSILRRSETATMQAVKHFRTCDWLMSGYSAQRARPQRLLPDTDVKDRSYESQKKTCPIMHGPAEIVVDFPGRPSPSRDALSESATERRTVTLNRKAGGASTKLRFSASRVAGQTGPL